jgi:hypothetical protein
MRRLGNMCLGRRVNRGPGRLDELLATIIRGVLAECIVAETRRGTRHQRHGPPRGGHVRPPGRRHGVEVKSAAYVPSWKRHRPCEAVRGRLRGAHK